MNLPKLVFAFIRQRPARWVFHVLTLALGVTVVSSLFMVEHAIEQRFSRDLAGVDLVIGAKGSPLQLVLSALFQTDVPTGNIPLAAAEHFARHPMVKWAVPVSMGDNVRGARIIGTTPNYALLYNAGLADGRFWNQPMEAVLGSSAAKRLKLHIGDHFIGQHGLSGGEQHAKYPYSVVGILHPTGAIIDRLVLTDTASVWQVHTDEDAEEGADADKPKQVTALLVKYRSPMGAVILPRQVSATPDLQPAVPAIETARLVTLLGFGSQILEYIGLAILILSAGGFLVALAGAVSQRRRELALLRALGAPPRLILFVIALEGALLGILGGLIGVIASRILVTWISHIAEKSGAAELQIAAFGRNELIAVAIALLLALAAALPPAWLASHTDPATELGKV